MIRPSPAAPPDPTATPGLFEARQARQGRRTRGAEAAAGSRSDAMLQVGDCVEAVFEANRAGEGHRLRARRLADGQRIDKVLLSSDPRISPGVRVTVRITRVRKPSVPGRGAYEAAFERAVGRSWPAEVWLDSFARHRIESLLDRGSPVLLIGPQGCGKTVLARTMAEVDEREFVHINCSHAEESDDFSASVSPVSSGDGLAFLWRDTPMMEALEAAAADSRRRFLICLDELNRAGRRARNALLPVLDRTRRIWNPRTAAYHPVPETVQFAAAVNMGARFGDTEASDLAGLDRWGPVHIDYPTAAAEIAIIRRAAPDVTAASATRVVAAANLLRRHPEWPISVSVRATEDACRTLVGRTVRQRDAAFLTAVLRNCFCGRMDGDVADPLSDAGRAASILDRFVAKDAWR